jgi:hypothetical protein
LVQLTARDADQAQERAPEFNRARQLRKEILAGL